MRFTTLFIAVLVTLFTAVSGAPQPELFKINVGRFAHGLRRRDGTDTALSGRAPQPELYTTNAARFAHGLPPLPQRSMRRRGSPVQGM